MLKCRFLLLPLCLDNNEWLSRYGFICFTTSIFGLFGVVSACYYKEEKIALRPSYGRYSGNSVRSGAVRS